MTWLLVAILLAAAAGAAEALTRVLVAHRIRRLLAEVVETAAVPDVVLPPGPLLPGLVRGRLAWITIAAPCLRMGGLDVHDARVDLCDLVFERRLTVTRGAGVVRGHLKGDDVRRLTGAPRRVRLDSGLASVRVGRLDVGVRPVVQGDRIQLAPTPLSLILPPLPAGVRLVAVDTADGALLIEAEVDVPTLLSPPDQE